MSDTVKKPRKAHRIGVPWSTDLVTVGAAVVCATVMWICTVRLGSVDLVVEVDGSVRRVGGAAVALTALVAAALGIVALRALERLTPRGLQIWTALAVAATTVSALGPFSAQDRTATGTLLGLHAVVAVVVIVSAHMSRRSCKHAGHQDAG